jgi:hypothetical protein
VCVRRLGDELVEFVVGERVDINVRCGAPRAFVLASTNRPVAE